MTREQKRQLVIKVLGAREFKGRSTINALEVVWAFGVSTRNVINAFQWAMDVTDHQIGISTTAGLNSIYGLQDVRVKDIAEV